MDRLSIETFIRPSVEKRQLSSVSKDILLTLLYFDIFKHPLTVKEILHNSSIPGLAEEVVIRELEELENRKLIHYSESFYFLPFREQNVERRINGNLQAEKYIQKAYKMARLISRFPFVRGIFLSGSVSKGYADKNSDIDYFIVTEPGRLWLCRSLLILYKKIFLLNSRKYFCLNYFIDSDHLEVTDRNIFTAKEINYLYPLYNEQLYYKILLQNAWTYEYIPNYRHTSKIILPVKDTFSKKTIETMFSSKPGEWLDNFFLALSERFWNYKFRKKYNTGLAGIRCHKHVSKFHPQNLQDRILEHHKTKIFDFEQTYGIALQA